MFILKDSLNGTSVEVDQLNRQSLVDDLLKIALENFVDDPNKFTVRLFYGGKHLLNDGKTMLFEYGLKHNDVIFVYRTPLIKKEALKFEPEKIENEIDAVSHYFDVGDKVDVINADLGSWSEAIILKIVKNPKAKQSDEERIVSSSNLNDDKSLVQLIDDDVEPDAELESTAHASSSHENDVEDDGLLYHCVYEMPNQENTVADDKEISLKMMVPRCCRKLDFSDVQPDDSKFLLVNYNMDNPGNIGEWYKALVKDKMQNGRRRNGALICDLFLRPGHVVNSCKITKIDEIYLFETLKPNDKRTKSIENLCYTLRQTRQCTHCDDSLTANCPYCRCVKCGKNDQPNLLMICDECQQTYHTYCLQLNEVPADEFYCSNCRHDSSNIVLSGQKIKLSKSMKNTPAIKNRCKRVWDNGLACRGLTKKCTTVPADHFGPIPGVEVGTNWQSRRQVSEAGVHRPPVAGISARSNIGSFSIVISGGYEDDKDDGDEVWYTGSGGRDLSGNKRSGLQSKDQTFDKGNLGLAKNCAAPLNAKGADAAKNWRQGKPIRVCRSYKLKKHSIYGPENGYRYDGIYKLVKYCQVKGQSGFNVYRYLLRRDDITPAPWTKDGQDRIEKLGLDKMIIDPDAKKTSVVEEENKDIETSQQIDPGPSSKRAKFFLNHQIMEKINMDTTNKLKWDECLQHGFESHASFVNAVSDAFSCIICCELLKTPITTDECGHSFCKECLKRSFKCQGKVCPMCRSSLPDDQCQRVNMILNNALEAIFPGRY